MSDLTSELQNIFEQLRSFVDAFDKPEITKPLAALEKSAEQVGKHGAIHGLGINPAFTTTI